MKENYLPRHMRIGLVNRIIRFFFGPLSIMAIISVLNYKTEFKTISDLCQRRYNNFIKNLELIAMQIV